jgi:hypothetical protein
MAQDASSKQQWPEMGVKSSFHAGEYMNRKKPLKVFLNNISNLLDELNHELELIIRDQKRAELKQNREIKTKKRHAKTR